MFAWVLGAVLGLSIIATIWIVVRGTLAYDHLSAAQDAASELAASLDDPAEAARSIAAMSADTAAARSLTSDPVWGMAEGLPWIGPQLAAVSTVTAAVDDVVGTALPPLTEAASSFSVDALRPVDGAIDLALFETLEPSARSGADGVAAAASSVEAIDESALLSPLRTPISRAKELLGTTSVSADALARATELMPAMLGAEGPRTYLVVFQNNAEWRSLGGIVGAMALIGTEGGRMSLLQQGSTADFTRYPEPVVPLPDDVRDVYGARPGIYIQNATQVADFELTGQIAREMWAREFGTQADGVISVDPVALSYLLDATGPITLPSGDVLTSDNAVDLLLNGVYQRYEQPEVQDAFFAATAAEVFEALSSGGVQPKPLLEALARAGDEHRLLLWSARAEDQSILDGTTLQGRLPVTDEEQTSFGVYLNDGTGSKMDYYMRAGTAVGWCTDAQGPPEAALHVTLRNDAPADAASLPRYITGGVGLDIPLGTARTVAYLYLPPGAELVTAVASGDSATDGFGGGTDAGRGVLEWTTELAPGETASIDVRVRTPHTPSVKAFSTPIVNALETSALAPACEPAR